MWEFLTHFFDTTMFSPHGICLVWDPELLTVHIASDAIIALSYFSIPFALAYFVSKRPDVEFGWVFWAFAIFIMACGLTHVLAIYTLFVPAYGIEGIVKVATAVASIATAALLWPLVPKALALPSPAQLRTTQALLEAEARQRREAQALLSHTQKMEAIGQLSGGIAHDFNNLLTVISGNLEIAQRAVAGWSENSIKRLNRALDSARRGAEAAAVLTERLLAFARKQPFDTKVFNPNHLIDGMSDFIARTVHENIRLEIEADPSLWNVETDPHQLESALLNLIVNSRDAMPSGGDLRVSTANTLVDRDYCEANPDARPGAHVIISVADTGAGMDQATRERAFEPFFSTKEVGRGTGLGLSQVYGFVRQSGGFVTIESSPGGGTTVSIYLPRSEMTPDAQAPRAEISVGDAGRGQTILVVEDDEDVRAYIVETLRDLGYDTMEAGDAEAAIELFKRSHVDLLLTDVVMPGKNGRVLSNELLAIRPTLKVLFMSGYSRDAILQDGRLERGLELLQKPVTREALAKKLQSMLGSTEPRLVRED